MAKVHSHKEGKPVSRLVAAMDIDSHGLLKKRGEEISEKEQDLIGTRYKSEMIKSGMLAMLKFGEELPEESEE